MSSRSMQPKRHDLAPHIDSKRARRNPSSQDIDSPSPLVSTLPMDILQLIFEYIDEKPRLVCLALVCKRWQAAVYRTMNCFHQCMQPALLPRLAWVKTLHISSSGYARRLSVTHLSRLTTVSLSHVHHHHLTEYCTCILLPHIPAALSSITLRVLASCPPINITLAPFIPCLTELHILANSADTPTIYFPFLRTLRLDSVQCAQMARVLIAEHASQLTNLVIEDTKWLAAAIDYPLLKTLDSKLIENNLSFVAQLPSCKQLELRAHWTPSLHTSVLRKLTCMNFHGTTMFASSYIHLATCLHALCFDRSIPIPTVLRLVEPVGSRLRTLQLEATQKDGSAVLRLCPSLQKLILSGVYLEMPIDLPQLSNIIWDMRTNSIENAFKALAKLLDLAPKLRCISLRLPSIRQLRERQHQACQTQLLNFFQRAASMGVHSVRIECGDDCAQVLVDFPWMHTLLCL